MVTNNTIEVLLNNGIAAADITALQEYEGRDGFELLDENDFSGMMQFLQQQDDELNTIVPVLTDNNSNYLCVFTSGENKGRVCYLSHDEINLTPVFHNITNLLQAIKNNPEAWDMYDMPAEACDFKDLPF